MKYQAPRYYWRMARRSAEANRVLRALDKQLAAAGERSGINMSWTPQETETLRLLADQIDRKCELFNAYQRAEDAKAKVVLSAELRLLEGSISRMLKTVQTDMPQPSSLRSAKARKAALTRWAVDSGAAG